MKVSTIVLGLSTFCLLVADIFLPVKYCSFSCMANYDGVTLNWLILIGASFSISVVLLFLPSRVYKSWWSFARIAIPVILIISTIINLQLHHRSGGLFNLDNIFDIPALILMYSVFIIGSLIQIYRGYYQK